MLLPLLCLLGVDLVVVVVVVAAVVRHRRRPGGPIVTHSMFDGISVARTLHQSRYLFVFCTLRRDRWV